MLAALVLLVASANSSVCATYAEGRHEIVAGSSEEAAQRHSSADRHFARGLKIIRRLHQQFSTRG